MTTSREAVKEFYEDIRGLTHAELADELRRPTMLDDWTTRAYVSEALARLLEMHPRVVAGETGAEHDSETRGIVAFAGGVTTKEDLARAVLEHGAYTPSEAEVFVLFRPSDAELGGGVRVKSKAGEFAALEGFDMEWDERMIPPRITFKLREGR